MFRRLDEYAQFRSCGVKVGLGGPLTVEVSLPFDRWYRICNLAVLPERASIRVSPSKQPLLPLGIEGVCVMKRTTTSQCHRAKHAVRTLPEARDEQPAKSPKRIYLIPEKDYCWDTSWYDLVDRIARGQRIRGRAL